MLANIGEVATGIHSRRAWNLLFLRRIPQIGNVTLKFGYYSQIREYTPPYYLRISLQSRLGCPEFIFGYLNGLPPTGCNFYLYRLTLVSATWKPQHRLSEPQNVFDHDKKHVRMCISVNSIWLLMCAKGIIVITVDICNCSKLNCSPRIFTINQKTPYFMENNDWCRANFDEIASQAAQCRVYAAGQHAIIWDNVSGLNTLYSVFLLLNKDPHTSVF